MGLYTELPADIETVDIIIAGGGTAGCIVASRLADADPNLSILVLEAGPNGVGNPTVEYPALFLANIAPDSKTASFYKSKPTEAAGGREVIVPTGAVLGGGSAINMMQYSRAQRTDFDSWNVPGWSTDELVPYMKKLETYHGPGPKEVHGSDGPIHVSKGKFTSHRIADEFISATNQVGWPEIDDLSGLDFCNGIQRAERFVSPDGKRQDTASRYLHPRLEDGKHQNLHVVVESQVASLLLEGKRAAGVVFKPKAEGASKRTVKARKLVVVSAGAFGTPAILERSGIGSPEVLKQANIPVQVDLPGVGREFEDHNLVIYSYRSALEPEETLDGILRGTTDPADLIKQNHPILSWNAQETTAKVRPSDKDVATFGPALRDLWEKEYKDNPNKPLMIFAPIGGYPGAPIGVPPGQYFGITAFTVYPLSRGHLHITGPELDDPVDFDTGFFSDPQAIDIAKHRWCYKKQREIARRMPVFRGEYAPDHPQFASDSKAAIKADGIEQQQLESIQDIEYTAEDDAIIDNWVRSRVGSTWHSLGTCKMAPLEKSGVVDAKLSVYGVEGLKLADLSIVPGNVAANTNHTALLIGEKAADIFIKELGLESSG